MARLSPLFLLFLTSTTSALSLADLSSLAEEVSTPLSWPPLEAGPWHRVLSSSLAKVATVLALAHTFTPRGLPGSAAGGSWWPPMVLRHDTGLVNKAPLDPYSVNHVNHGVLGFLATWLLGLRMEAGLTFTVLTAEMFEIVENTQIIIKKFRESGGPNGLYAGDSKINSAMDVLSCGVGFAGAMLVGPWISLGWVIVSEVTITSTVFIPLIVIYIVFNQNDVFLQSREITVDHNKCIFSCIL